MSNTLTPEQPSPSDAFTLCPPCHAIATVIAELGRVEAVAFPAWCGLSCYCTHDGRASLSRRHEIAGSEGRRESPLCDIGKCCERQPLLL
jgi:hypothetical protein